MTFEKSMKRLEEITEKLEQQRAAVRRGNCALSGGAGATKKLQPKAS